MLDELILHLHDEISLDGRQAALTTFAVRNESQPTLVDYATISNVHAEKLANATPGVLYAGFKPTLDDSLKSRIWDMLRFHPDIYLQLSDETDRSRPSTPIVKVKEDEDEVFEDEINDEYNDEEDDEKDTGVKIADISDAPKVTPIPQAKNATYSELISQFGPKASLTTSITSQIRAITGVNHLTEVTHDITESCMKVLEMVARSRETGVTQVQLRDALNTDSKNVFHFVKQINLAGYVIKKPMVTKGSITQLVILARYKDSSVEDVDENEVNHVEDPFMDDNTGGHVKIDPVATKVRISRCLEAAKDKSLAVEDLKPLLGFFKLSLQFTRWLNRNICVLEEQGYIQRFLVPSQRRKHAYTRCIQLVKPYVAKEDEDGDQETVKQQPIFESKSEIDVLADIPLEYQIYDFVREAGIEGASSSQLYASMPNVPFKFISKTLDKSFYTGIKQDPDLRLYRSACIDGRVRYWVYYTKEALANSPEVKSIVEKAKRICTIDDSDDIAPEIDPFNSQPGPRNYRPPNRNPPGKRGRPRKYPLPEGSTVLSPIVVTESDTSTVNNVTTTGKRSATPTATPPPVELGIATVSSTSNVDTSSILPQRKKRKYTKRKQAAANASSQEQQTPSSSTAAYEQVIVLDDESSIPPADIPAQSNDQSSLRKRPMENDEPVDSTKKQKQDSEVSDSPKANSIGVSSTKQAGKRQQTGKLQQTGLTGWLQPISPGLPNSSAKGQSSPTPKRQPTIQASISRPGDVNLPQQAMQSVFSAIPENASLQISPPSTPSSQPESMAIDQSLDIKSQPDAPSHIAGIRVVNFPSSWTIIKLTERNASFSYFRRRQEIFLQVLQQYEATLFDQKFLREVSKTCDASMLMTSGRLDRKSSIRAIIGLIRTGEIKAYPLEFKRLSGSNIILILLMVPHLTPDSDKVIDYVQTQKEETYMPLGRSQKNPVPMKDLKVERITDRIKRLEKSIGADGEETHAEARKQLMALKESKRATEERKVLQINQRHKRVRMAISYGYIYAKMIRAKIFMLCLRQLADINGSNTVVTSDIIRRMTLRTFVQTIGIYKISEEARKICSDERTLDMTMQEMDQHSRKAVWSEKQSLSAKVKANLEILHSLGLIKPEAGSDSICDGPDLSSSFQLMSTVQLRDYTRPGLPELGSVPIRTMAEIEEYWEQLRTSCLRPEVIPDEDDEETQKRVAQIKREQAQLLKEKGYIPAMCLITSWEGKFLYNEKQIDILESYINMKKNRTPFNDPIMCEEIAIEADLPLDRVRQYYKQVHYYRMKKFKSMKLNPSEKNQISDERMTIHTLPIRPYDRKPGRRAVISRRNARRGRDDLIDEDESMSIADTKEIDKAEAVVRPPVLRVRHAWSPIEDEILLFAYVIIQSRSRIIWEPVQKVLPNRKISTFRKRISLLTKSNAQQTRLYKLIQAWQSIYRDGIKKGKFDDLTPSTDERGQVKAEGNEENSTNKNNFDLTNYLRYFLEVMQDNPGYLDAINTFILPSTLQGIRARYVVKLATRPSDQSEWIDRWDEVRSSSFVLKSRILSAASITLKAGKDTGILELVHPIASSDAQQVIDVKVMLKMILLTSGDKFNPRSAYQTLYRYPVDLVREAVNQSVASNVLTKTKYAEGGRTKLPPRTFGMTERFLTQLSGSLPERIFAQATAYRNHLMTFDSIPFSHTCSSGMIYCLLDMFAARKATFKVTEEEHFREMCLRPAYVNRMIGTTVRKYECDVHVDLSNKTPPPLRNRQIDAKLSYEELKSEDWKGKCDQFVKATTNDQVSRRICDLLEAQQAAGISLLEIKRHLRDIDTTDQRILEVLQTMRNNTPPLVYFVGAGDSILVSPCHVRNWAPRLKKTEDSAEGKLIPARMWFDMNGEVMNHVLRGCLRAVLEQIQRNPGITTSTILHKLKTVLVAGELTDLLKILEERQCIRSKAITYPGSISLFSRAQAFHKIEKTAIVKEKIFCYWTLPDCWFNMM